MCETIQIRFVYLSAIEWEEWKITNAEEELKEIPFVFLYTRENSWSLSKEQMFSDCKMCVFLCTFVSDEYVYIYYRNQLASLLN